MAVIGAVQALYTSDTSDWSAGAKKAKAELSTVEEGAKKSFKEIRSGWAAAFGKKSELAQNLKFITKGTAFAGLGMLGNSLANGAKGLESIAMNMDGGKKSANDWAVGVAKGLPVIGGYAQAAETVLGLMTGTTQAIAKNNKELAQSEAYHNAMAAAAAQYKAAMIAVGAEIRRQQRALAKDTASPLQVASMDARQKLEDTRAANKAALREATKGLEEAARPGLDALREQLKDGGDAGTRRTYTLQLKKLENEKNALRAQYAKSDALADQQYAVDMAQAQRKAAEAQGKARLESARSLRDAELDARLQALKAAGHAELAEIVQIQQAAADKTVEIRTAAEEKLKTLGIGRETALGAGIMNNADAQARAAARLAQGQVDALRAAKDKELGQTTDADRMTEQLKEYRRLLDDGIIGLDTYNKARKAALDGFRNSILPTSGEEGAVARYKKQVEELAQAYNAGLIGRSDFQNGTAEAQRELRKAAVPEFQASENQVRRFSFGRLTAPDMANPVRGLLKVNEDQAATQKAIAAGIVETNKILRDTLKPQTVSLK